MVYIYILYFIFNKVLLYIRMSLCKFALISILTLSFGLDFSKVRRFLQAESISRQTRENNTSLTEVTINYWQLFVRRPDGSAPGNTVAAIIRGRSVN